MVIRTRNFCFLILIYILVDVSFLYCSLYRKRSTNNYCYSKLDWSLFLCIFFSLSLLCDRDWKQINKEQHLIRFWVSCERIKKVGKSKYIICCIGVMLNMWLCWVVSRLPNMLRTTADYLIGYDPLNWNIIYNILCSTESDLIWIWINFWLKNYW